MNATKFQRNELGRSGWKNAFLGAIYQRDTRVRVDHEQRCPTSFTPVTHEQRKPAALPSVLPVSPGEIT